MAIYIKQSSNNFNLNPISIQLKLVMVVLNDVVYLSGRVWIPYQVS